MGIGYEFTCEKCGHTYDVMLGSGFLLPSVYEEAIEDIREGKMGEEYREILLENPWAAVDCENELYKCRCGNWSVEQCNDLYLPKDPEAVRKMKYGEKTAEELGELPYVMQWELKENFTLARQREHRCKKCGREMRKILRPEAYVRRYGLPCPKCGEKNRFVLGETPVMYWD